MPDSIRTELKPLVDAWKNKLKMAVEDRRAKFDVVAEQCMEFYAGAVDFLWSDKYQKRYFGAQIKPRFRVTINKAFELVSIYLPLLYAKNPTRCVQPYRPIEFGPEVWLDEFPPEQVEQVHQWALSQQQQAHARKEAACSVMEAYLNYTPREQPGTLKEHCELALTEALIKGRGVLWPETFTFPESDRRLTGLFWDTVDNLYIDPDANSALFGEAKWIARKHVQPHWEVERRFKLKYGTLREKGAPLESGEAKAASKANPRGNIHHQQKRTFDLVTWYEVFSIGGIGGRLSGMSQDQQNAFEEACGDYCYMCFCDGYDWPLNAPDDIDRIEGEPGFFNATVDDIRAWFSWPVPYYRDRRWPCQMLDFWKRPKSSWPISHLAPALGELICLNILISNILHKGWEGSRTIAAVAKSASKQLTTMLKSADPVVVAEIPNVLDDIRKHVFFLEQPEVKTDAYRGVEYLFHLFEQRTGLNEVMYGAQGGATTRVAADIQIREEKSRIRPDHMAAKVEDWMGVAARAEFLLTHFARISGQDVRPLLGPIGAHLWDKFWTNADTNEVLAETICTIEAGSARKPNKERDLQNIQAVYPHMAPLVDKQADVTGDTSQLNELNRLWGKALDMETSGLMMGPRMPPQMAEGGPTPQQIEAEQQAQAKDKEHDQEMIHREEEHDQELRHTEEDHRVKLEHEQAIARIKRVAAASRPKTAA